MNYYINNKLFFKSIFLVMMILLSISCHNKDAPKDKNIKDKLKLKPSNQTKIITKHYPVQVKDTLFIETSNSIVNYNYQIVDTKRNILKGGVLYEGIDEIDCSFLPFGEYLLVVKETNEIVSFIKI